MREPEKTIRDIIGRMSRIAGKARPALRSARKKFLRAPKKTALAAFAVSLFFLVAGVVVLWAATLQVPDLSTFNARVVNQSTKIYDRTGGILLYSIQDGAKRTVVPLNEMSPAIKNATIAIEDAEFYEHRGIKPRSIIRAVLANIRGGGFAQGGSTITQQVVKNTLLTREKTLSRKFKELVFAVKLERVLSKERILELYLNEIPYGGSIYGIEEASRSFFGKNASTLSVAEAAYLAALPQAPTFYSPYGNHRNDLGNRKNLVLKRMRDLSFISEEEYARASEEQVLFLPQETYGIKAPHFVTWIREQLAEKYGEDALAERGFKVVTTLDYRMQEKAEKVVSEYAEQNEKSFGAYNAGMTGVDPRNGDVLLMVGSRDYFRPPAPEGCVPGVSCKFDPQVNMALRPRQPGSAFKPFVYATAFLKGYTPETVLFDVPTQFETGCSADGVPLLPSIDANACYTPQNYDLTYRGPINLRGALAQSVNVPAIKVLYLAGIRSSLETARAVGIQTLTDPDRYGLTLVLGGGEVSLLEITGAYGVFGNGGVRNPPRGILRVEDGAGTVLEEASARPSQALPPEVAAQINDILSDNAARAPAFGERSALFIPGKDVAVKTGTTNDYKDAWIVGYTPSFALGAWAGNNDNSSMEKKVAGFIVAPLWNAVMRGVIEDPSYQDDPFPDPPTVADSELKPVLRGIWRGGETYFVDSISGKLATEHTPMEAREERVITNVHTILYWVDKNNPRGPRPEHPERDPQFALWEKPVREWALRAGIIEGNDPPKPTAYDDVHTSSPSVLVRISSPQENAILSGSSRVSVEVEVSGRYPIASVDFYLNDVFIGSSSRQPYSFSFIPEEQPQFFPGENSLRVIAKDAVFNRGEARVRFTSPE